MLSLLCLAVFLLQVSYGIEQDILAIEPEEQVEVGSGNHTLVSRGFPDECCKEGRWRLEALVNSLVYWKIVFTDLDLPPGSQLLIEGQAHKGYGSVRKRLATVHRRDGHWHRPSISYYGRAISITFLPPEASHYPQPSHQHTFTGFKAHYWIDASEEWLGGRPLTECPYAVDPMLGGQIEVSKPTLVAPEQLRYDHYECRWLLKPPDSDSLMIYVRVDMLDIKKGYLKIYQGISSPGIHLVENEPENVVFENNELLEDHVTVTSRKGFYITLVKPLTSGVARFQYGVYSAIMKEEACTFLVGRRKVTGFRCERGKDSWCIPSENICDSVVNCPNKRDEDPEMCEENEKSIYTLSMVPANLNVSQGDWNKFTPMYCTEEYRCDNGLCRKPMWNCPEEECESGQRRCPDSDYCVHVSEDLHDSCPENEECKADQVLCDNGICVSKYYGMCPKFETLPHCGRSYKMCNDGQCVFLTQHCAGQVCPEWKQHSCDADTVCYYDSDVCDGLQSCQDGKDEKYCEADESEEEEDKQAGDIHWWIWLIVGPALVFIVASVFCCLVNWRKSSQAYEGGDSGANQGGYSGIPMQSASEEPPSPQQDEKGELYTAGNSTTVDPLESYEILNAGKTYGQGYKEGCMQFY